MILNGVIDRTGFYDFSLARSGLTTGFRAVPKASSAVHPELSCPPIRELGTVVAVKPDSTTAQIVLDTLGMRRVHIGGSDTLDLHAEERLLGFTAIPAGPGRHPLHGLCH